MTEPYLLGLYEKSMPDSLSLREKLEAAKAAGYDYLELSIDESDARLARLKWTEDERRRVVADMLETGFYIRSICLSGHRKYPLGHPEAAVRARGMEIMADCIRLAADLGVRIIQLAGYDVYYLPGDETTRALFGENLSACVELAAREGVMLAFETMETEFLNTVAKARGWVDVIGSPWLQIYPDSGNITNAALGAQRTVAEDLFSGRGHLAALHLKESVPGVFREVPYGSGHVDFKTVTETAYRLGVRRFLAEFWYDGGADWERTLAENCRFLRGWLDRAAQAYSESGRKTAACAGSLL